MKFIFRFFQRYYIITYATQQKNKLGIPIYHTKFIQSCNSYNDPIEWLMYIQSQNPTINYSLVNSEKISRTCYNNNK